MAFNQEQFIKNYTSQVKTGGFDINKFASKYGGSKVDTKTSQGLYNLAVQSGLQRDADRAIQANSGEETKKIFSGGFISDIFDTLNALQYGVVGLLKGKSFLEGVQTRQSFTDKDALGDKGIPGMIAGIALDIAADPLTYIAPATIIKKIPFATKALTALKEFAFGKKTLKVASEIPEKGLTNLYQELEGGTKVGKWFADKFVYMFGADPVYRNAYEKSVRNIGVGTQNIIDMSRGLAKLTPEVSKKILTRDETGRVARIGLKELSKILTPDELAIVKPAWEKIDKLGQEAVDLGLLSKSKYEENLGEYIKNAYEEYELAKKKWLFGFNKIGVKGIKSRKVGLTAEKMTELGQIDNPAYLLFKSAFDLTKDIENAKLFKATAERFGGNVAKEGWKQLPQSTRFVTSGGRQADILTGIKKINQEIKPTIKNLSKTFAKDKETLSLIKGIEKSIGELSGKRADELTKFFNEGSAAWKTREARQIIKGVGKLPDNLKEIGDAVRKFKKFDDLMNSDIGIKLEKLYQDGILERAGFKDAVFKKGDKEITTTGLKQFFNFVKKPFKTIPEKKVLKVQVGDLPKVIQLQKEIEELVPRLENIKGINKRSIDDAYRYFEDTLNTLSGKKEQLVEQLKDLKYGDLAGKYVPENIYNAIQTITEPVKNIIGKELVANFKFAKVILNPATHARNIMSNQILNWWKLGMNPLDPRTIAAQSEAIKEIASKGGKWIEEAKSVGYGLDTFASQELKSLLESPEAIGIGNKLGNTWHNVKNKIGDVYQGEENFAKLSAFIFNRKKGVRIEDAWKAAESATFNYAQVTPFVRKLRTAIWGAPFITFTVKATPVAVETALKAPGRISVFGKIKQAIENQSDITETQRERMSEPAYIRDGFYIKLPMKDKNGNSAYFDLTYIIPFGDLVAGNFFERQTSRKTGLPESIPSAVLSKSPLFNFVKEISKNQDFYGDKIWNESDTTEKQIGDLTRHISKTYLPPLVADQIPGGYKTDGTRRQKGIIQALSSQEKATQQRILMQEMLRNVGAKIQPIDADIQETYKEWNTKKALETLLKENGILKEYSSSYLPK